jgi:hypothetical protein
MGEFKPGHTSAGKEYQYAQDNIGDAEDKYYPGRDQRMEEGVHFAPLINLVITGLLQFDFTGTPGGVFDREHGLVGVGPDYLVDSLDQGLIEFVAGV